MSAPGSREAAEADRSAVRVARLLTEKLEELWRARELLAQFVRKELMVRYKNSTLGFLWSLLTPLLMTVVFTIVFGRLLDIDVDDFAVFFLSGFLTWQFFQNSVQSSIHSIVGNGDLIKKVYFPREVLPLSHVLAQLIHLLLALLVVSPYFVWARGWGVLVHLPAVLAAVALLAVFTAGVAMAMAAVNVPFRDLQELIVVIFLVWFYATPVVYPPALIEDALGSAGLIRVFAVIVSLNPMTWFVRMFREPVYGEVRGEFDALVTVAPSWPNPVLVLVCFALAFATFTLGYVMFQRLARTFAKEV